MQIENRDLYDACLKTNDYRSFLNRVFEIAQEKDPRFSYASFSRKAGFTSRGFVKEVVSGRKRLTAYSFPRFVKALSLPSPVNHYFTHLVALEEEELNADRLGAEQLKERLNQARAKAQVLLKADQSANDSELALFKGHQVLEIISVLGNPAGISLEQIVRRTRIEPFLVGNILRHLISKKLVINVEGDRFASINPHFVFDHLGEKSGFKEVYLETLGLVRRKVTGSFNHPHYHFQQSYFSVNRDRLPELKTKLRKLINEFVQAHENDDGDTVAKLHLALID